MDYKIFAQEYAAVLKTIISQLDKVMMWWSLGMIGLFLFTAPLWIAAYAKPTLAVPFWLVLIAQAVWIVLLLAAVVAAGRTLQESGETE